MAHRFAAAVALMALLAAACAAPMPDPGAAARLRQTDLRAAELREALRARLVRVFRVGYAVRTGGRALCGDLLVPEPGALLAPPETANALGKPPGDTQRGLHVLDVHPAGALARAGVAAGDVLITIAGRRADDLSVVRAALLSAAPEPVVLELARGAKRYVATIRAPRACGVDVGLSEDWGLMTFEQDGKVAVPYGLLETADDELLAIAVAHQIAHTLIRFATAKVADEESTADRLGLLIAASAGADVTRAPELWTWLASESPWRIPDTRSFGIDRPHPDARGAAIRYRTDQLHVGIAARLPAIRATVAEIQKLAAAQTAGGARPEPPGRGPSADSSSRR